MSGGRAKSKFFDDNDADMVVDNEPVFINEEDKRDSLAPQTLKIADEEGSAGSKKKLLNRKDKDDIEIDPIQKVNVAQDAYNSPVKWEYIVSLKRSIKFI